MNRERLVLIGLVFSIFVIVLASVVVSTRLRQAHNLVVDAALASREIHRISDLMRQSSNDLTRMVRLYALTGDIRYREYFQEILDIRNGLSPRPEEYEEDDNYWVNLLATGERLGELGPAVSFETVLQESQLPESELALVRESEKLSNDLAIIEEAVMEVIDGQVASSGGDFVHTEETIEALGRLYDAAYMTAKIGIFDPLSELEEASERRIAAVIAEREAEHRGLAELQLGLVIIAALLLVGKKVALLMHWRGS